MAHYHEVLEEIHAPYQELQEAIPGVLSGYAEIHRSALGEGDPPDCELGEGVPQPPTFTPLESPIDSGFVPGVTPSFIQHFTMRWLSGTLPFTGSRVSPRATIEVGLDDAAPANEAHVVAIADAIPPLALSMLTEPAPGSSATWTLEMLTDRFDGLALAGWRLHAELRAGRDGYTRQYAMVCAPGGHAVALSQQVMTVFG